ncbi:unnamed protein product, partial [Prorocentrum cordatum]
QVEEAVSLLRAAGAVPAALWAEARSGGLLHEEVPLPLEEGLQVVRRALAPTELTFGGIWIGPGPDNGGEDSGTWASATRTSRWPRPSPRASWTSTRRPGTARAAPKSAWAGRWRGCQRAAAPGWSPRSAAWWRCPTSPNLAVHGELRGARCAELEGLERVVRNDFTSRGAAQSMSESLARMGLSSVHGLRIHDPNDNSNYDGSVDEVAIALAPGGMLEGLRQLRAEGRIQHVGLGMNCNRLSHQGKPDEVLRLLRGAEEGTFDSALLAGGWNLLSQDQRPRKRTACPACWSASAAASRCKWLASSALACWSGWTGTPTRRRPRRRWLGRAAGARWPRGTPARCPRWRWPSPRCRRWSPAWCWAWRRQRRWRRRSPSCPPRRRCPPPSGGRPGRPGCWPTACLCRPEGAARGALPARHGE